MAQTNVVRIPKLSFASQDLPEAIDAFLSRCRCKNLSPNTILYYGNRLAAFRAYLEMAAPGTTPADVNPQLVREFLADQSERHSAATACHGYCTLRAFFGFLVKDGFLSESPMTRVDKPKQRKVVIDTFSLDQVESILATCRKDFTGVRDRALILLMLDSGLRASEAAGLTINDLDWTEQTMLVVGKGDKERIVPFGKTTRKALNCYLSRRGTLETDAFFVSVYGQPIDRYRTRHMLLRRCRLPSSDQ